MVGFDGGWVWIEIKVWRLKRWKGMKREVELGNKE